MSESAERGERELKKAKMNDIQMHTPDSNDSSDGDRMIIDDEVESNVAGGEYEPSIHNNIDLSQLPEAECVEQFLENPLMVKPKSEFLNLLFNEDDTILTHAVRTQNVDAVAALVRAGADPNTTNK